VVDRGPLQVSLDHHRFDTTYKPVVRKGKSWKWRRGVDTNPQQVGPKRNITTMVYMTAEIPSCMSATWQDVSKMYQSLPFEVATRLDGLEYL
jgi:hypothetical protein